MKRNASGGTRQQGNSRAFFGTAINCFLWVVLPFLNGIRYWKSLHNNTCQLLRYPSSYQPPSLFFKIVYRAVSCRVCCCVFAFVLFELLGSPCACASPMLSRGELKNKDRYSIMEGSTTWFCDSAWLQQWLYVDRHILLRKQRNYIHYLRHGVYQSFRPLYNGRTPCLVEEKWEWKTNETCALITHCLPFFYYSFKLCV
jgi:hypothetical protein